MNKNEKESEQEKIINRRRICAYLGNNKEVYEIVKSKIFTSNKNAEHWLDSNLEGWLCFYIDHERNTRYLVLYSFHYYEKLMELELYNNFDKYYTYITDLFYCFEYADGFIGLKFSDVKSANSFKIIVNKINDKLLQMISANSVKKDPKDRVKKYIKIVKKNFSTSNTYTDDYIEKNTIQINKPRYFELLGNIKFDKEKKRLIVDEKETKEILRNTGITKKAMRDTKFALEVFKSIIESLEKSAHMIGVKRIHNINNEEVDVGQGFEPKKKEVNYNDYNTNYNTNFNFTTNFKEGENTKIHEDSTLTTIKEEDETPYVPNNLEIDKPNILNIPIIPTISNIPKIPNIPNLSTIPKININIPKITPLSELPKNDESNSNSVSNDTEISNEKSKKEEELLSVKLVKAIPIKDEEDDMDVHTKLKRAIEKGVVLSKVEQSASKKITLDDKRYISSILEQALEDRRKALGHDDEYNSDSDWSDD